MTSEVIASLAGTVIGAAISFTTTAWFQAVQKKAAERKELKSYNRELAQMISAIYNCMITHEALKNEVETKLKDCQNGSVPVPLVYDFPLASIEYSAAALSTFGEDYAFVALARQVCLKLKVVQEHVRLTKQVMGVLGVSQGAESPVQKGLKELQEDLEKREVYNLLKESHSLFVDAFIQSSARHETFDEDHPVLKYMLGRH